MGDTVDGRFKRYKLIEAAYDDYEREMIDQGVYPMRETDLGFWGTSTIGNIYELFIKIRLQDCRSFVDLGSGDGRVANLASVFTSSTGIEYDKPLFERSLAFKRQLGLSTEFVRDDFLSVDLSGYDVAFIYPDKRFTLRFENKLEREFTGRLFVYTSVFHPSCLVKGRTYWVNQTPVLSFTARGQWLLRQEKGKGG
ncbi:hypothetical protein JXB02_04945 [Candidatus Woesearchaeota archaeon]|nr:hypothetical protein [Candidatus Woesearchaeota archaeon]